MPSDPQVRWQTKVLGEMKLRIKLIGKFTFHFMTAIYLLTPLALLVFRGGDALLPYESALCTGLSGANGYFALKNAWRAVK